MTDQELQQYLLSDTPRRTKGSEWKELKIEQLLVGKLPNVLSDQQKKTKVSTILEALKRNDVIEVAEGRLWKLKEFR